MKLRRYEDLGPFDWDPEGSHILAEAHTDDHAFGAQFDAAPYFEKASDEDLIRLAEIDWRGDYPADWIAEYMAQYSDELKAMFAYLHTPEIQRKKDAVGFEVSVNYRDALIWIREHRPHLLKHPAISRWI